VYKGKNATPLKKLGQQFQAKVQLPRPRAWRLFGPMLTRVDVNWLHVIHKLATASIEHTTSFGPVSRGKLNGVQCDLKVREYLSICQRRHIDGEAVLGLVRIYHEAHSKCVFHFL